MTAPAAIATAAQRTLVVLVAGIVLGAGGGLGFAWHFWRPKSVVETPAVSVRQPDSSLVLQRAPDAHAKPAQQIPKGATVERVVHVEVQPKAPEPSSIVEAQSVPVSQNDTASSTARTAIVAAPVLCPPIGIDLTLIRLKDGTQRVIASSKDGLVLDSLSVDHPVVNATVPRTLAWVAGPLYASHAAYGAFLGRQTGPALVMAGGTWQARGGAAFVGVGIRF